VFQAIERATLLYRDAHQHHLFILVTGPCGRGEQVLLVPVCSHNDKNQDTACMLERGDHGDIKHTSYVDYYYCRTERARKLVQGVESGFFSNRGMLDGGVFERVLAGFEYSQFVKPFAIEHLRQYRREQG